MKSAANIFGGLLIFIGAIWGLQGAGFLPGELMNGKIEWLVIGIIIIIVGIGLIVWRNRQNSDSGDE
jgi:hypothetical protein